MKITNQHIGILIWSLFSCIPILYLFGYIELPTEISSYNKTVRLTFFSCIILFLTSTSFIIEGAVLVIGLLTNEFIFEIKLDSPFANYWKSRQELNKKEQELINKRENLYVDLFNAKSDEQIDLINKKLESLK